MNPIVAKQFGRIDDYLDALHDLLKSYRAELNRRNEQNEKLRLEHLRHRKELTVLKRAAEDYDRLDQANKARETIQAEVRQRLNNILAWTKALGEELRS